MKWALLLALPYVVTVSTYEYERVYEVGDIRCGWDVMAFAPKPQPECEDLAVALNEAHSHREFADYLPKDLQGKDSNKADGLSHGPSDWPNKDLPNLGVTNKEACGQDDCGKDSRNE